MSFSSLWRIEAMKAMMNDIKWLEMWRLKSNWMEGSSQWVRVVVYILGGSYEL